MLLRDVRYVVNRLSLDLHYNMVEILASRCNTIIAAFYQRLLDAGKMKKVALAVRFLVYPKKALHVSQQIPPDIDN